MLIFWDILIVVVVSMFVISCVYVMYMTNMDSIRVDRLSDNQRLQKENEKLEKKYNEILKENEKLKGNKNDLGS